MQTSIADIVAAELKVSGRQVKAELEDLYLPYKPKRRTKARIAREARIAYRFGVSDKGRPADAWLARTVRWAWKIKLFTHLDLDLKMRLQDEAARDGKKKGRGGRPSARLDKGESRSESQRRGAMAQALASALEKG